MGYVHTEIANPLLLNHPTKWRDTTCSNNAALPLHTITFSLTQSQRLFYNDTIQYTTILQCFPFIGELPWENTTGHPIPWDHKLLANKYPKKILSGASAADPYEGTMSPRNALLGQVYSKIGLQTWMHNNISEWESSGSSTNNMKLKASYCLVHFDVGQLHDLLTCQQVYKLPFLHDEEQ